MTSTESSLLTAKDLERIRRMAPLETDVILQTGSTIEGYSNSRSDVDIFVMYQGPHDADRPSKRLYALDRTGQRLQIECISEGALREHHALVVGLDADPEQGLSYALSPDAAALYYRTCIGVPLSGTEASWSELRSRVPISRLLFQRVYAQQLRRQSAVHLACAHAASSGPPWLAARELQVALVSGVSAYLADNGHAYPSYKWLFEKIRAFAGDQSMLYRRTWTLKGQGSLSLEDYESAVVDFLQELNVPTDRRLSLSQFVVTRHPDAVPFELQGNYYVFLDKVAAFRLSRPCLEVWNHLTSPRQYGDLVAAVGEGRRAVVQELITHGIALLDA